MQQLELLLPLVVIILIGFVSVKLKLLPQDSHKVLNKIIIFVTVPILTITSLATLDPADINKFPMFTLASLVGMAVFALILFFVLTKSGLSYEKYGSIYESVMEGNVIYFGYPIILGIYGNLHMAYAAVFVAIVIQVMGTLNAFLLTAKMGGNAEKFDIKKILKDFIVNPFILSTVFGLIVFAVAIGIKGFMPGDIQSGIYSFMAPVNVALTRIAGIGSPLALLSLGIFLAGNFKLSTIKLSLITTFISMVIFPAWMLFVTLYIFRLDKVAVETTVLLAAMPTAIFAIIASDLYGYDKNQTTNSLIISSFLLLLTLPMWLWILSIFVK